MQGPLWADLAGVDAGDWTCAIEHGCLVYRWNDPIRSEVMADLDDPAGGWMAHCHAGGRFVTLDVASFAEAVRWLDDRLGDETARRAAARPGKSPTVPVTRGRSVSASRPGRRTSGRRSGALQPC